MSKNARNYLHVIRDMPKLSLTNTEHLNKKIIKPKKKVELTSMRYSKSYYEKKYLIHPIGILGVKAPWYTKVRKTDMYDTKYFQRPLKPISLLDIQRMIDTKRLDISQPIDLTSLMNTYLVSLDTEWIKEYGFSLLDEGADQFKSPINIEVQHATEAAIAAVERAGGVITTRYYDLYSVSIKKNVIDFFYSGMPIPKCKLPPLEAVEYYSEARNRGYLCDRAAIDAERYVLAQKYGYTLPESLPDVMSIRKDARQLFSDLDPGWVVNMLDEEILVPVDEDLKQHYQR